MHLLCLILILVQINVNWKFKRIIHLQNLANQLPYAFIDTKKVAKSHILAAKTPARMDVPKGQLVNESQIRLKSGRPIDSKYITPRKMRTQRKFGALEEANIKQKAPTEAYAEQEAPIEADNEQDILEEVRDKEIALEEPQVLENYEILISYVHKGYK